MFRKRAKRKLHYGSIVFMKTLILCQELALVFQTYKQGGTSMVANTVHFFSFF